MTTAAPQLTTEHTFLTALVVTRQDTDRAAAEHTLHAALQSLQDSSVQGVTEWWVAEDDRRDRSDNASAIFVQKGYQTAELFDRLPEQARHTLIDALRDGIDYRGDNGGHCSYCDDQPEGSLCEDHQGDADRATAYRALLDLIGEA